MSVRRHGLRISEVAKRAGVSVQTLRFYERRGLLGPPPRTESGYRDYPDDAVLRVRFIKRAQRLGFTLDEVSRLLELRDCSADACEASLSLASAKLTSIRARIQELVALASELQQMAQACETRASASCCPFLEALEPPLPPG